MNSIIIGSSSSSPPPPPPSWSMKSRASTLVFGGGGGGGVFPYRQSRRAAGTTSTFAADASDVVHVDAATTGRRHRRPTAWGGRKAVSIRSRDDDGVAAATATAFLGVDDLKRDKDDDDEGDEWDDEDDEEGIGRSRSRTVIAATTRAPPRR